MRVASHPPHRPVRAAFPHTVPTSGIHGDVAPYAGQRLGHAYPVLCPGRVVLVCHSPRPPPLAPPAPQRSAPSRTAPHRYAPLCSSASQLLWQSSTSRCPCIIGYDSSTSPCGPSLARDADGQSRDLPASDAIRLHVMWPLTPAGRQHLAFVEERCRTCCLRANKNSRPLRYLTFRGSIPHPVQSLCTLRNHCRQWPRNTRYQADATPYLGRTFTGWIAPALCWRTYSITSSVRSTTSGGMVRP